MSKWTKQRLAEAIYAEMEKNGGERVKAARKVVERIGNSGQAKPFLDDLGPFLLTYFEREWCRTESPSRPQSPTTIPDNYGRNLKAEAKTIAGAMVPIGNTGLRKPIGQINSDEALAVADYHAAMEDANRRKKNGWQMVATDLPEGQSIGEAWSDLPDQSREFLRSVARVDAEAAA